MNVNSGYLHLATSFAPSIHSTFICTGLGRSGTTMLAKVLVAMGLHMGDELNNSVYEDQLILRTLRGSKDSELLSYINIKNDHFERWGFKVPNLHVLLNSKLISSFRRPIILAMIRDSLAIASRESIAEHLPLTETFIRCSAESLSLIQFLVNCNQNGADVHFFSYEKAIADPEKFIGRLCDIIGMQGLEQAQVASLVNTSDQEYLLDSQRMFDGNLEGVFDGYLLGWVKDRSCLDPVEIELIINTTPIATQCANIYRQDLFDAGIGNGSHGYRFAVHNFLHINAENIHIRVKGRTINFNLKKE